MYSDLFVLTTTFIDSVICTYGCEYAYNVFNIKLIPFEICSIHKRTHLDSLLSIRKMLIILINDSNYSSKFAIVAFIVVAFTTK